MADRRMFHRLVVESDKFLDLPVGAQALYFHLGMQADDDGFVNGPRLITRQLKRPYKDLQALIDSGFLLEEDGIVVLAHWRMANCWKTDRLQLPRYPEFAKKIYIKASREYTLQRFPKCKNLLKTKVEMMDRFGNHLDVQKKTEKNKTEEKKIKENKIEYSRTEEPWPPEEAGDETPAPDKQNVLEFLNGRLGKGVVLLTQEQMTSLLDQMGLDSFDYYVERLADYILKNQCKIRNHYDTILKWWNEDRSVNI